jgi:ABC-type dipeptide/oligopeptide/nickel transport system permease subunit
MICVLAPLFAFYDPYALNLTNKLAPPSIQHILGTDELGRDVFSRILYGGRFTITVSLMAVLVAIAVGVPLGIFSGYSGKFIDDVFMRVTDLVLSIPYFLFGIVIVSVLGPSLYNCMLAITIRVIGSYIRLVRGMTLEVKELDYVKAAKISGQSRLRIMLRHILPNISAPMIVLATLSIADAILQTAALGFIGLGAQPPSPEWGAMLGTSRYYMFSGPHLLVSVGLVIGIMVLGFNLVGDALRDMLDPRMRALMK